MGCGASKRAAPPAKEPVPAAAAPAAAADAAALDAAANVIQAAAAAASGIEVPAGAIDLSKCRMRIVVCGQPEGGFAASMGACLPYFTSIDPMMPEGVKKEVFLTTADERTQFILLFMDPAAEPAVKAQYGETVDDPAWKAMEGPAKEYGMMEVLT